MKDYQPNQLLRLMRRWFNNFPFQWILSSWLCIRRSWRRPHPLPPPRPRVRHLRSTDSLCTGSYVAWLQPSYNGRWKPWNSCRQLRLSDSFNAVWRSSTGFRFQTGITLSAWNRRLRASDSERAASVKMVCSEVLQAFIAAAWQCGFRCMRCCI